MALIKINRHPSAKDLRLFSALGFVFLATFGFVARRHGYANVSLLLWGLGGGVGLLGVIAPRAVRPIYLAAVYATFPIGFVLSHVILAVVYFGIFMPIGLLMRLLGRDPLQRRFEPQRSTYWRQRPPARPAASYLKQY